MVKLEAAARLKAGAEEAIAKRIKELEMALEKATDQNEKAKLATDIYQMKRQLK